MARGSGAARGAVARRAGRRWQRERLRRRARRLGCGLRAAGLRREAAAAGSRGSPGAAYKEGARPREAQSRAATTPPVSWPDSGKVAAAWAGWALAQFSGLETFFLKQLCREEKSQINKYKNSKNFGNNFHHPNLIFRTR